MFVSHLIIEGGGGAQQTNHLSSQLNDSWNNTWEKMTHRQTEDNFEIDSKRPSTIRNIFPNWNNFSNDIFKI